MSFSRDGRVLRKHLHLKPYRVTMVTKLKVTDLVARKEFFTEILHRLDEDGWTSLQT